MRRYYSSRNLGRHSGAASAKNEGVVAGEVDGMKLNLRNALVGASLALTANAVTAHHGDAGRYEETVTTVTGTVVEFQFVNPHSLIVVDVADASGSIERWIGELGPPSNLTRNWGWTRTTLEPGQEVTLTGRKRKNGEPYMTLSEHSRVVDAEGKELFRGD
jgi:hypothetical protein